MSFKETYFYKLILSIETVHSLSDGDALPTHLFALIVMLEATKKKEKSN